MQPISKTDLLQDAVRISRLAGSLLKDRLLTDFSVEHKGDVDLVTEMDRAAQDLIESEILVKYPDHGILAEEDLDLHGSSGFLWIVDPLDGTTNYAHRFPVFSVSIAVAYGNETLCGVVYNPVSDETFKAVSGEGASLNAMPLRVSNTGQLTDSLLGTGFPYSIRETPQPTLGHFERFVRKAQDIRRCGSAALDLCFVACGRLDGFWELDLKPWDVAAGMLIVREAGGMVTDFSGSDLGMDASQVLASNGLIHKRMMEILSGGR
jgi:myo-inositol-1(or 4)-monophosphatase